MVLVDSPLKPIWTNVRLLSLPKSKDPSSYNAPFKSELAGTSAAGRPVSCGPDFLYRNAPKQFITEIMSKVEPNDRSPTCTLVINMTLTAAALVSSECIFLG